MRKIIAPQELCLYRESIKKQTLAFISALYQYDDAIIIDFSQTTYISAMAALVVFAHINRIQLYKQNAGHFVFDYKKSSLYKEIFIRGKYLSCLNAGTLKKLKSLQQQNAPFQSGFVSDLAQHRRYMLSILDYWQKAFLNTNHSPELISFFRMLKTAISEVLINITNHAYLSTDDIIQWWYCLWFNNGNNTITFIIYDLGVGIVESYLNHSTKQRFSQLFKPEPLDIFKEALQEGRSRFVDEGRGYGLAKIIEMTEKIEGLHFIIQSGRNYCISENKGMTSFQYLSEYDNIPGTIIEWVLTLPRDN